MVAAVLLESFEDGDGVLPVALPSSLLRCITDCFVPSYMFVAMLLESVNGGDGVLPVVVPFLLLRCDANCFMLLDMIFLAFVMQSSSTCRNVSCSCSTSCNKKKQGIYIPSFN
jgi:hypothetical protein